MDLSRPESHGPFTVLDVPNHPAADVTKETRAIVMVCSYDARFHQMDDGKDWITANVTGTHEVLFKVPAWLFSLFPGAPRGERTYEIIKRQLNPSVAKSLNNALSIFDSGSEQSLNVAEVEARKWG